MSESGNDRPLDDRFEQRLHEALEERRPDRDPAVRRRLDRGRRLALAEPPARCAAWWLRGPMVAAGCLLVVTTVATIITQLPRQAVAPVAPPPLTADLDIITDPRFELLLEDLEFVAWLASDQATSAEPEQSG